MMDRLINIIETFPVTEPAFAIYANDDGTTHSIPVLRWARIITEDGYPDIVGLTKDRFSDGVWAWDFAEEAENFAGYSDHD